MEGSQLGVEARLIKDPITVHGGDGPTCSASPPLNLFRSLNALEPSVAEHRVVSLATNVASRASQLGPQVNPRVVDVYFIPRVELMDGGATRPSGRRRDRDDLNRN